MLYRFRDFEADPAKGSLRRGGEEVPLRRKAFQVLIALLEHQDRLVSKDELFAWVWPDTSVTDDVLAGVIAELRKALADNPKAPLYIKTVPRIGYRFIGEAALFSPEEPAPSQPPGAPAVQPPPPPAQWRRLWPVAALAIAALGGWLVLNGTLSRFRAADDTLREVAWWRFDEPSGTKAADSSGSGNSAELFGGIARVPGKM